MFDNVGRDLDQEARKRQAQSLVLTTVLMVGGGVFSLVLAAWTVKEQILDLEPTDTEMVEVVMEDAAIDEAPPPPPPPPPPPSGPDTPEEEEEDDEPKEPDEMVEDVKELDEKVEEKIENADKPKGQEGGVDGGQEGGQLGGVLGGDPVNGVLGGQLGGTGSVRTVHHSAIQVKKRVDPVYPDAAQELGLGEQRCIARVFIDAEGIPYDVQVEDCPKVFHRTTRETLLRWRWYPYKDDVTKQKTDAQFLLAIRYVP